MSTLIKKEKLQICKQEYWLSDLLPIPVLWRKDQGQPEPRQEKLYMVAEELVSAFSNPWF